MFWRAIAALCALTFLMNGCLVLSDGNCKSVDIGGAGRRITYTCYPNETAGGMSAPAAGGLMLLGGLALLTLAAWPLIRMARENRSTRYRGSPHMRAQQKKFAESIFYGVEPSNHRAKALDQAIFDSRYDPDSPLRVLLSAAYILKRVARQEGVGSVGWTHAKRILVLLTDDDLTLYEAHVMLMKSQRADFIPGAMPEDLKWVLLRATLEIAVVDGEVSNDEQVSLIQTIRDLWGYSEDEAIVLYLTILDRLGTGEDPKRNEALQALGLDDDATTADIREAYLTLIRQHHPDLVSPEDRPDATATTANINAAYEYLMGAAIDSNPRF